jgi:hypothetical protein
MRRQLQKHRLLAIAIAVVVVASGTYAYASNVAGVTPPLLGSGSAPIPKYTLSGINYNLDSNGSANNILSISFTLTPATTSTNVRIQVTSSATWYSCSSAAAPTITCATIAPQITATSSSGHDLVLVATG